jgi:hypothetical protein
MIREHVAFAASTITPEPTACFCNGRDGLSRQIEEAAQERIEHQRVVGRLRRRGH